MSLEHQQAFCNQCGKPTLHARNTVLGANLLRIIFALILFSVVTPICVIIGGVAATGIVGIAGGSGEGGIIGAIVWLFWVGIPVIAGIRLLCKITLTNPPFMCSICGQGLGQKSAVERATVDMAQQKRQSAGWRKLGEMFRGGAGLAASVPQRVGPRQGLQLGQARKGAAKLFGNYDSALRKLAGEGNDIIYGFLHIVGAGLMLIALWAVVAIVRMPNSKTATANSVTDAAATLSTAANVSLPAATDAYRTDPSTAKPVDDSIPVSSPAANQPPHFATGGPSPKSEEAKQAQVERKQPAIPQDAHEKAKTTVARLKRNINSYVGPDVGTVKDMIGIIDRVIREYESGDEKAQVAAYAAYTELLEVARDKPVYGYKYNAILKRETAVPIVFGIYRNSDRFYIKVGDGDFCTVAPLPIDALLKLIAQIGKINKWCDQCIQEGLDVDKDAGAFGGVQLRFVSENNADDIYVWLTVRGAFAKEHLVKEQTVSVNMLNLTALQRCIGKAKELYNHREKIQSNADELE